MGDPKQEAAPCPDAMAPPAPSRGIVDFILARADADKISARQIGLLAGITRARCGNVLHRDPAKRHPLRLDEIHTILDVLKIDRMEAHLANELLAANPAADERAILRIVLLVSEFVRGLPAQIVEIVSHIDGLELEDIRPEHGRRLQTAILKIVHTQYRDLAARREFRIDQDGL